MAQMTAARTTSISLERLLDEEVRDAEGHDVGRVEDLILDSDSGTIDFAIVKFGGFLGINSRYHLIPWPALKVDAEHRNFMMDVTKDRVDQAPAFDRKHVPTTDDTEYLDSVFQYWGFDRHEQHQRAASVQYGEQQATVGGSSQQSYDQEESQYQSGQQAYGQEQSAGTQQGWIAGEPQQQGYEQGQASYGQPGYEQGGHASYGQPGYEQGQAYGGQEELPGYGRGDIGRDMSGGSSERQVSYGNGVYGPERRTGRMGSWSGSERRAGW